MKKIINLLIMQIFIISILFAKEKTPLEYLHDNTPLEPTKVFDNLYCIGSVSVVAWAINTSDGIILIDSMWDNRDAKLIEDGLKKLGLDPKNIKYILISHGHGDHYGGAKYLKDKYNCKVVLSEVDTKLMYELNTGPNTDRAPKAEIDIYSKDKDVITLGDTQVTILSTPGHTAGCSSFIFPVKYNNKEHIAVLWGGTGVSSEKELKYKYKESAEYFKKEAIKRNADIALTAHLFHNNGYENLKKVAKLKKGEKNPFLLTKEEMNKYLDDLIEKGNQAIKSI